MGKTLKKILTVAGVAAAGAAVLGIAAYATTKLMVKTALDREEPEIMKKRRGKISGSSGGEEGFEIAKAEAQKKLLEEEHETVKIVAADNVTLVGHFYPVEDAKRVIIAFHGWRSSWGADFGMISDFWHNTGCSVLYAEQRGQNASGGEHMGFGLTERHDCIEWVNWVNSKCDKKLPIYLAGVSMGASTVLMASDSDFPDNVRGIIADCGFTSPKEIWEYVARHNMHLYTVGTRLADAICRKMINVGSGDYSTKEALKKTKVPVLFIHGEDDNFVPVDMTYENYDACASSKSLLIVPGADHAMSYYVDKESYERALREFFEDFDNNISE